MRDAEKIAQQIKEKEGYVDCRSLLDGSIACVVDLLFTRAIIMGVDEFSYKKRFCFDNKKLAMMEYEKLATENDEPVGFIARR